jgi:hypothetical protein
MLFLMYLGTLLLVDDLISTPALREIYIILLGVLMIYVILTWNLDDL